MSRPLSALTRVPIGDVALAMRRRPGAGRPVLWIHGSFDDHRGWLPTLAAFDPVRPIVVFDRRGHGASTDVPGQGRLSGDVADAAGLIAHTGEGAMHVVGHSYGANIAIALANRFPERVASLVLYEPPVFGLLRDAPEHAGLLQEIRGSITEARSDLEAGQIERGTAHFVEHVAFGPGAWRGLFDDADRGRFLCHADTWLDQARDPERFDVDIRGLEKVGDGSQPAVTLVSGSASLPSFQRVVETMTKAVPALRHVRIAGAGHGGPRSHPTAVADAVAAHLRWAGSM
ncbi:MAG: alpha/beta hydrolase [Myxococcota bacterium]